MTKKRKWRTVTDSEREQDSTKSMTLANYVHHTAKHGGAVTRLQDVMLQNKTTAENPARYNNEGCTILERMAEYYDLIRLGETTLWATRSQEWGNCWIEVKTSNVSVTMIGGNVYRLLKGVTARHRNW